MSNTMTKPLCLVLGMALIITSVSAMTIEHTKSVQEKSCDAAIHMLQIHNMLAPFMDIPSIPFPQFPMCYPTKFSEYANAARIEAMKNG